MTAELVTADLIPLAVLGGIILGVLAVWGALTYMANRKL